MISCVAGFGLGAAIGLFSASLGDTDLQNQTIKTVFLNMKTQTLSQVEKICHLRLHVFNRRVHNRKLQSQDRLEERYISWWFYWRPYRIASRY